MSNATDDTRILSLNGTQSEFDVALGTSSHNYNYATAGEERVDEPGKSGAKSGFMIGPQTPGHDLKISAAQRAVAAFGMLSLIP
jgi:hypothetical protein